MASMNQFTDPSLKPYNTHTVILVGVLALAVAMGIGRFAFTPLLPLMLRDGTLSSTAAHSWASANYIGYLVGALTASLLQRHSLTGLKVGLLGIALMTLSTGLLPSLQLTSLGLTLRFGCGLLSAWILVCTSSWCLTQLMNLGESQRGSWIYTGVGAGIAVTGSGIWFAGSQPAADLWIMLGLLALTLSFWPLSKLHRPAESLRTLPVQRARPTPQYPAFATLRHSPVLICYAISGFGYIIPATYLPLLAQQQSASPQLFGLTWPVFGLAALGSVTLVALKLSHWPHSRTWALAQGLMAAGVLIPIFTHSLALLILSALLVGGTFMITTLAGLQLAREREPLNPTPLLGLMTAGFAAGQIAGPVLVQQFEGLNLFGLSALELGCASATLLLVLTTGWLARLGHPSPS